MAKQITAVRLNTPFGQDEHHHHITDVEWTDLASSVASRQDVVKAIRNGVHVFVRVGQAKADVEIEPVGGTDYIRTKRDHTKKDNLLSLPRF